MLRRLSFAIITITAVACGGADDTTGSGGAGGSGGSGAGSSVDCNGNLSFLQKDAYKETAGRSTTLWPPHTTTELSWTCDDGTSNSSFRDNHGTEPGATDANGDVFLVETAAVAIEGDPTTLASLRAAYDACECNTTFLSLDALGDDVVQDLVTELSQYILDNLTCTGAVDAQGLVGLLQQGEIEAVIAELPNCTWAMGFDWEGGFDDALGAIINSATETLADYHVCNNDAALQAKLVQGYLDTGMVTACNGDDPICNGPMWFYEP